MSERPIASAGPVVAAADVGSNTIKMTVARWDGQGLDELASDARTVRLSAGIEQTGVIAPERQEAAIACLVEFATAAQGVGATVFIGVATEVVRIAGNGAAFLARVAQDTPWRLDVISGDDEASLTFAGARADAAGVASAVIADIGGASTELIAVANGEAGGFISLPVGSGRLTDRYVKHDPPGADEVARCRDAASDAVLQSEFTAPSPLGRLLVTGGTGIYLGALVGGAQHFPPTKVAIAMQTLKSFPTVILSDVLRIPVERARVLPAGVAMVAAMIDLWSPAEIAVTESGVRRGLLLRYFAHHQRG